MNPEEMVFFTAGHGFYQFHIDRKTYQRSLYYNLLLQPHLAAPDHFFLQGRFVVEHLAERKGRDTWLEIALRNGFLVPFFREGHTSFSRILRTYRSTNLKGFTSSAEDIAERLDGTFDSKLKWDSHDNSVRFRKKFESFLQAPPPKLLDHVHVDFLDYIGFLERSKRRYLIDIALARERANDHDSLPISLLLQATTDRLFGAGVKNLFGVDELLAEMYRRQFSNEGIRDIRILFTLACEYYNRTLAESLLAAANSPRWCGYLAALDLAGAQGTAEKEADESIAHSENIKEVITLPVLRVLRKTSGDVLLTIRRRPAAKRYFESLVAWKRDPSDPNCDCLIDAIIRYAEVIRYEVGSKVATEQLMPRFLSRAAAITEFLGKTPSSVFIAFLAPAVPDVIRATAFSCFCLKLILKAAVAPKRVPLIVRREEPGIFLGSDTTLLRRSEGAKAEPNKRIDSDNQ